MKFCLASVKLGFVGDLDSLVTFDELLILMEVEMSVVIRVKVERKISQVNN